MSSVTTAVVAAPPLEVDDPLPLAPGAWAVLERLLRDPAAVTAAAVQAGGSARLVPVLVRVTAVGAAVYGLAIGLPGGTAQGLITAIKLPVVLLGAACLTLPVLHVACQQAGVRMRLDQLGALVLQALATATVTMACLAPFVTVCWLTVSVEALHLDPWFVYRRVILAGLAVAAVGCLVGVARMARSVPLRALAPWTLMFGLASLQLTWLLRPVVGMPDAALALVRPLESNAITEVLTAVWAVLTGGAL